MYKVLLVSISIGFASLMGLPPFSGFFSKDLIIELMIDEKMYLVMSDLFGFLLEFHTKHTMVNTVPDVLGRNCHITTIAQQHRRIVLCQMVIRRESLVH